MDDAAHMTTGAFKTGTHDDLATALGLAVLQDKSSGGFRVIEDPDPIPRDPRVDDLNVMECGF